MARFLVTLNVTIHDMQGKVPKQLTQMRIIYGARDFELRKQAERWKTKLIKTLLTLEDISLKRN